MITDRIMTRQTCCKYKSDIIYYIIQPECYIIFISPSLSATQEYTPDPVLTMTMIWFLLSHQNRYIASFDLDLKEFMWFVWAEVLHLSSWLIVKLSHRRRLLIWRENIKRFLKRILNLLNLIKYFPSSKKYSFSSRSQQW